MPAGDDAKLIALGRQISALRALEREADAEVSRCSDVYESIKPAKPHALLWRQDDPIFLPPSITARARSSAGGFRSCRCRGASRRHLRDAG
jgi:hypothetical protein